MIRKMFCIYDSKAELYIAPFCMKARGEAIRAFTDSVNDPGNMIGAHPADFHLFEVGEFDDEAGMVSNYEPKVNIGNGLEFVADRPLPLKLEENDL